MHRGEANRLAILGAGPVGLEAALLGVRLGFEVQVYERGRIGEHLHRWGHVRMFTPFGMNSTAAGRQAILAEKPDHTFPANDECITGREHVRIYLEPLARTKLLKDRIHTECQVVAVGRERWTKSDSRADAKASLPPFRLLVREKNKERIETADYVFDCTGTFGRHRWLGEGGIPAVGESAHEAAICYGLDDIAGERKGHYAGRTTLVVGGGFSAATSVVMLSELASSAPETWVIWLARTSSTLPIRRVPNDPLRERDRLAVRANTLATRADGNVEFHPHSFVTAVESLGQDKGFRVTARIGRSGQQRTWEVDRLIANVGYLPDWGLLGELQLACCPITSALPRLGAALLERDGEAGRIPAMTPELLRTSEPDLFVLGAKSFGRDSRFLLGVGFEQVRQVLQMLTGKKIPGE
ncbi:MAG: NAD(P)-binding domain-containing protein [Gemmatales bacterium]|nr:NAD(P)-binding domain-containing protein [Gemmatales bacterium]MDW8386336.1 FAD-dependent oxidoreductase [Gemmatales bacterium]